MGSKTRIATGTLKPLTLLYVGHIGQSTFFLTKIAGLAWPAVCMLRLHQRQVNGSFLKRRGNPLLMGSQVKNKGYPNGLSPSLSSRGLDSRHDVAVAASPTTSCPLMVVWGTEVVCVYKGSQDQSPILFINIRRSLGLKGSAVG